MTVAGRSTRRQLEPGTGAWLGVALRRERVRLVAYGADSRVLDAGPGIDPASVRVDGDVVGWTHGGEARSASVASAPGATQP